MILNKHTQTTELVCLDKRDNKMPEESIDTILVKPI